MVSGLPERLKIVAALKYLDRHQSVVEDNHGNLSLRTEEGMLIKPSGMAYSEIQPPDLSRFVRYEGAEHAVEWRWDNDAYSGKPSVDSKNHTDIYTYNPWVRSICHTHSPYATSLAMVGWGIPVCCTEQADYFGHPIRCLEYRQYEAWGAELILPDERAVLLGNHGTLIVSPSDDPMDVAKLAVALEIVAKKYWLARQLKAPNHIERSEVERWHERYTTRYGQ